MAKWQKSVGGGGMLRCDPWMMWLFLFSSSSWKNGSTRDGENTDCWFILMMKKLKNHITKTTRMTLTCTSAKAQQCSLSQSSLYLNLRQIALTRRCQPPSKCLIIFIKIAALWFLYVTSFCLFWFSFPCLSCHNAVLMIGKTSWLFGRLVNSLKCPQAYLKNAQFCAH